MSKPRGYRWLVVLFVLANVLIIRGAETPVKVWEAVMTLPVYQEGPPEENPPFDAFEFTRFNYPYTLRENLTGSKKEQALRALYLENEYLKCVVLPDIGGHLYSCTDKINGAELFYANSAIKKAEIGYRGAWAAFGIEFNFPVSHNWVSMSPVDFAIQSQPDGSASIWVGNVDRVYGMQWRVRLVLRPRSSMLEQRVMLYNCSDLRHRFYWWNNAAVQVWDDSRIFYPMRFTASHGFRDIDTWPVNSAGRDLSVISNQLDGPVSRFAHGSREPFMGVYHPKTQAGTVHFAEPAEVPAKKIWSWGADADAMDWRRALSDDNSAYVEIQGGLFRNQETYGFLPSQETLSFREYWIPVREIGGISRANPDGVVYVQRSSASQGKTDLALGMNVTHAIRGRVRVRERSRTLWEQSADFSPERTFKAKIPGVSANEHHTVELIDADGKQLLAYTEDEYDYEPVSAIQLGRQHPAEFPVLAKRSEGDFVEVGNDQELNGKLLVAVETYRQGLERFPKSFSLNKALGRLALALTDFAESERRLRMAQHIVSNDPEIHYLLGLALFARSDFRHAEIEFEHALLFRNYRPAAAFALARLFAQQHDLKRVLEQLQHGIQESPASVRMGAMEVALLRRLGQTELARKRLSYWLALDPTSSALRYEETKLMEDKAGFWQHLAADPERVLDVASDYVDFRFLDDARALLERNYPAVEATYSEPGNVLPQDHPLVHYYRGSCLELQGKSGDEAFAHAASLSSRYVFPHRAGALPVLAKAIEKNPNDAQAHFLLGSLMMSGGNSEGALNEWEQTRRLKPKIPVLHRNMAYTELFLRKSPERALTLFREGLEADPKNLNLYTGITRAMSLLDRPASERVDVLRQYDSSGLLPSVLVYELALSLVEDDKAAEAEGLFKDRFFPRREGGVNVRQVYLEVLLQKALSLAQHGNSAAALNVVNHIESEVPGFSFTKDGLDIFINHARFQFLLGEVYARSGQGEAGKAHWNKAVQLGASGDAVNVAFAVRAARQLDTFDAAVWKARLERSLEHFSSESDEDAGPNATLLYAKGLLLQALGREVEAQAVWKKVPFLPDRGLAHYLVRMARKNP